MATWTPRRPRRRVRRPQAEHRPRNATANATRPHPFRRMGPRHAWCVCASWCVATGQGSISPSPRDGGAGLGHLLVVLGDTVEVDVVGRPFGGALLGLGGRPIGTRRGEGLVVGRWRRLIGHGRFRTRRHHGRNRGAERDTTDSLTTATPSDRTADATNGWPSRTATRSSVGICRCVAVDQWLRLIERPLAARYTSRAMIAPITEPMMPDGCSAPSVPSSRKMR